MNQSFLVFGREPSISLAELYQFIDQDNLKISVASRETVLVNDANLGQTGPEVLAGVIKSGMIIKIVPTLSAKTLALILEPHLKKQGKFDFGLSFYGVRFDKKLGLEVKKILKQGGASVRLVESRSGNLSSADVVKNKLLDKGVELCVLKFQDGFLIGQTQAVQPFEEYSERDYGRPARDARSGMLPPKLAKTMVNLAVGAYRRPMQILDPFCGSGTVLQEAMLMGHNVIGTDIESQAINNAKKNIEWLVNRRPELVSGSEKMPKQVRHDGVYRIEKCDVRQLGNILSKNSVGAIVSEFDLGPALSGREPEGKIRSIVSSLTDFYSASLQSLRPILKPEGRLVLAWPYFKKFDLLISLDNELGRLGWKIVPPYPENFIKDFPLSRRQTLIYGRQNQYLWREIVILKKEVGAPEENADRQDTHIVGI